MVYTDNECYTLCYTEEAIKNTSTLISSNGLLCEETESLRLTLSAEAEVEGRLSPDEPPEFFLDGQSSVFHDRRRNGSPPAAGGDDNRREPETLPEAEVAPLTHPAPPAPRVGDDGEWT